MFSTLGPDTFLELREPSKTAHAHANTFMDMHDVGDILLTGRWVDPVMDMDKLTVYYKSWPELLRALRAQGVRNMNEKRNPGLTGRRAWAEFKASVEQHKTADKKYPLTYEVVCGHAWKGAVQATGDGSEFSISVSSLRETLKR